MSNLIEVKGLCYATGSGIEVFKYVEAEFHEGERVAVIGPLGSGKATLLRLILGLERPQKGSVQLFGKNIGTLEPAELDNLRQGIGVVFENAALISNLKVIENVMLPLQYHTNLSADVIMERAVSLLECVGYRGDVWELPGPLPYYTKKSIALARAMALDPAIMIYDRLMEGLDVNQSLHLLKLVEKLHGNKNNRLSIMLANDETDVKDMIIYRMLKIDNGRLV